jgi:hypothetical protein
VEVPELIEEAAVRVIAKGAFQGLAALRRVSLPFGVAAIENGAFDGCPSLELVAIPASVASIAPGAFSGCSSLAAIEVEPRNRYYQDRDGVLFDKEGKTLLYYPAGRIGDYTLPPDLRGIAPGAFGEADKLSMASYNAIVREFGAEAFDAGLAGAAEARAAEQAAAENLRERRTRGPVLPGRTGETFYVAAHGSDEYDGRSEERAFKSLGKALAAAAAGAVRTITLIGAVEGGVSLSGFSGELLITGKPLASAEERARLTASEGAVIEIRGSTKLRLEHAVLSGGSAAGVRVEGGAVLTLGSGARIEGNSGSDGGGASVRGRNSALIMEGNAVIAHNTANTGGGVSVGEHGALVMKNNARITGNRVVRGPGEHGRGGGVFIQDAHFVMQDGAEVSGNEAFAWGGGLFAVNSTLAMRGGAAIRNNGSDFNGGGAYLEAVALLMEGDAVISGNRAAANGGGMELQPMPEGRGSAVLLRESAGITNNEAKMRGGGLLIGGNNRVILEDEVEITGNQAQDHGDIRTEQGARLDKAGGAE